MLRDGVTVTNRMLKYIRVPRNGPQKERVSLLLQELLSLLDTKKWRMCVSIDKFYDLFGAYAHESQSITKLLKRSVKVYLITISLGQAIERRSREYFKNSESFNGYVADRLGSFLVEEEIRNIDSTISRQCSESGYTTTRRYSPGYGDFSINAQQIFFDLAKDSIPELKISPGCLMSPEKTVTAIKGMIKNPHII
ncbi:MAG: hypothetical protein JRE23_07875 [Deltaproteobacteria bacterium]|nr:hypothetical protein [Deltaproteobacteria bacterium]